MSLKKRLTNRRYSYLTLQMQSNPWKHKNLYLLAMGVRILLIIWGTFTDVDYHVFTDAAALVAGKGATSSSTLHLNYSASPYARITYRYTPLLAWILVPNIYVHISFGKILFSALDLVAGWLSMKILLLQGIDERVASRSVGALWLLNPIVFTISTRGSAESIMATLVLSVLYLLLKRQIILSAMIYGLAVHFKIYPIIYAWPILLFLKKEPYPNDNSRKDSMIKRILNFFNRDRLLFGMVSASVFMGLTYYFYKL
jgi:phosphatidylinositol glycan class M